jgi:hypothetical protein
MFHRYLLPVAGSVAHANVAAQHVKENHRGALPMSVQMNQHYPGCPDARCALQGSLARRGNLLDSKMSFNQGSLYVRPLNVNLKPVLIPVDTT